MSGSEQPIDACGYDTLAGLFRRELAAVRTEIGGVKEHLATLNGRVGESETAIVDIKHRLATEESLSNEIRELKVMLRGVRWALGGVIGLAVTFTTVGGAYLMARAVFGW